MIPLPLCNMSHLTEKLEFVSKEQLPKQISEKGFIISKGTVSQFKAKNLDRFVQMTVKGLNMYYYDFGIAYPANGIIYPAFLYQIIIAPKRVLVVVNYPFNHKSTIDSIKGFDTLLEADKEHSDMLIRSFRPQEFLVEDVISNSFNGLIRTTEIDKAYDKVIDLFEKWYCGIEHNIDVENENAAAYSQWLSSFKQMFYKEDYGYTAAKKFLGRKWSKEVFQNYLFR